MKKHEFKLRGEVFRNYKLPEPFRGDDKKMAKQKNGEKVDVRKLLDQLANIRGVKISLTRVSEEYIEQAFRNLPDIKEGYDNAQFELGVLSNKEAELTSQIQNEVLKAGESIKGGWLQAVWSKGKTTWDTKKLEGFALAHPEINKCKKVGNPSVSIREVKGNSEEKGQ